MRLDAKQNVVGAAEVGRSRRPSEAQASRRRLSVIYLNKRYPLGSAGRFQ